MKIGQQVQEFDGRIGVIVETDDPHNILIRFEGGGVSYYCSAEDCELYDESFWLHQEELRRKQ